MAKNTKREVTESLGFLEAPTPTLFEDGGFKDRLKLKRKQRKERRAKRKADRKADKTAIKSSTSKSPLI